MASTLPQRTVGKGAAAVSCSAVAYGAMSLVGGMNATNVPSEEDSIKVIRHCLSCGINMINTSDLYGAKLEDCLF